MEDMKPSPECALAMYLSQWKIEKYSGCLKKVQQQFVKDSEEGVWK